MSKCERTGLVICRDKECHAMFSGLPENFSKDPFNTVLPCGHLIGQIILSATLLKDAFRAQKELERQNHDEDEDGDETYDFAR